MFFLKNKRQTPCNLAGRVAIVSVYKLKILTIKPIVVTELWLIHVAEKCHDVFEMFLKN